MIRRPVVAGQFYPASKKALEDEVRGLLRAAGKRTDAVGALSPHAGYPYSGPVAGKAIGAMQPKQHYVILGPNHTGMGARFALDAADSWRTPLGEVSIDKDLARRILKECGDIEEDHEAHAGEHSIEVQIPFLQCLDHDFSFVPIVVSYDDVERYTAIGRQIAQAIRSSGCSGDVAVIASSDMTHYEPQETAKEKDAAAIEAILALDEDRLDRTVRARTISMCGCAPACIMLACAKELGARTARLVDYRTSGDAIGDYTSVVGYAGVLVCR